MVIGHLKSPCHACKQPPKNGQFKLVNVHSSQILDPWPQWREFHLLHVGPPEGASDSGPSCVFPQCTRIYIIDKNPRNHIRNTLATNHISWTYYLAVIPSNIATTRQHPPHHLQAIAQLWQVWEGVTHMPGGTTRINDQPCRTERRQGHISTTDGRCFFINRHK